MRDDFSKATKITLAQRVGYLCSNPDCQKSTSGPSSNNEKSLIIGIAAHITAASKNGPRYDPSLSRKQRKNINNGIWLCSNCAGLIDKDQNQYSKQLLLEWKTVSEFRMTISLESLSARIGDEFISDNNGDISVRLKEKYKPFSLSNNKELIFSFHNRKLELQYYPYPQYWEKNYEYISWVSPYYYILPKLNQLYNDHEVSILHPFLQSVVHAGGVEGISSFLFNYTYRNTNVPTYDQFYAAIKNHFKGKHFDTALKPVGPIIYAQFENNEYKAHTYEGRAIELNQYIDNQSYEEILTMTNSSFWSQVYLDRGIEKSEFIPELLRNWERYWKEEIIKGERGEYVLEIIQKNKQQSWRALTLFSESYNDVGDIIDFAYDLDAMELYPMVVYSMLNIFEREESINLYCEYEFEYNDWECICIDKSEYGTPMIFLKEAYK